MLNWLSYMYIHSYYLHLSMSPVLMLLNIMSLVQSLTFPVNDFISIVYKLGYCYY